MLPHAALWSVGRCVPKRKKRPSRVHGRLLPPDLRPQRPHPQMAVSMAAGNYGADGSAVWRQAANEYAPNGHHRPWQDVLWW